MLNVLLGGEILCFQECKRELNHNVVKWVILLLKGSVFGKKLCLDDKGNSMDCVELEVH